jgi:hypothetical protein
LIFIQDVIIYILPVSQANGKDCTSSISSTYDGKYVDGIFSDEFSGANHHSTHTIALFSRSQRLFLYTKKSPSFSLLVSIHVMWLKLGTQ